MILGKGANAGFRDDTRLVRSKVRSSLDRLAATAGVLAWYERRMRRGLAILMYHRIVPRVQCTLYPLQSLVIPDDVFASQMDWLSKKCTILPVRDMLDEGRRTRRTDRPFVAVTFDDGYADNAEIAAPILERYGVRGTFFVTSGFVASKQPMWFDRAATAWVALDSERRSMLFRQMVGDDATMRDDRSASPSITDWMQALKEMPPADRSRIVDYATELSAQVPDEELYRPMSVEQLRDLRGSGHEIGAHSVTHPILPQLNDRELATEVGESNRQLEEWIGDRVEGFCYPNGDLNDRVEAAVSRAGFSYACTTSPGLNLTPLHAMRLHRISITMHRTLNRHGEADLRGFRSEISLLRERFRRK